MTTTERAKPYPGHLKARFYEIRTRVCSSEWADIRAYHEGKAPGTFPKWMSERYICSPDLRTHICSITPSIPIEWMDCDVEWEPGYEPTEVELEYWENACIEYAPEDRFNYYEWYDLVDGSREGLGHSYKFRSNVVASHDMGIIELDENQKEEVDEEDETQVERLLWDIAREEAYANEHV